MIRAGRRALDRHGVGAAHGMSESEMTRRRPWAQDGHPAPVNKPAGRRGGLWDEEQVRAHVAGEPIPALPTVDDPGDLLDAAEAAELAGLSLVVWINYGNRPERLTPEPDEEVGGQPHWRRGTIAAWLPNRPGRGAGGGRSTRSGVPMAELRQRAGEIVAAAAAEGRELSARALARELDTSPTTAGRLLAEVRASSPAGSSEQS